MERLACDHNPAQITLHSTRPQEAVRVGLAARKDNLRTGTIGQETHVPA